MKNIKWTRRKTGKDWLCYKSASKKLTMLFHIEKKRKTRRKDFKAGWHLFINLEFIGEFKTLKESKLTANIINKFVNLKAYRELSEEFFDTY